jgi:hypothetical protein
MSQMSSMSSKFSFEIVGQPLPRWRQRLEKELAFRSEFVDLNEGDWQKLLQKRRIASSNHDTVLSLDWPHFCGHATQACGGIEGWCYTFQGNQAGKLHNRHAAMVDVLARAFPTLFAEAVLAEVIEAVEKGLLPYPNIRYSGSGEVTEAYLPALAQTAALGVRLWGFTRNLAVAEALRQMGAAVIISCDRTSGDDFIRRGQEAGFPLAYTSSGVMDHPPQGTVVTFPIHRVGRVREVVDSPSLCPKVLSDFLDDCRPEFACQRFCQRCHNPKI